MPPPPPSADNKTFFIVDPNMDIPKRVHKTWDLPKTPAQESKIYTDIMTKDIAVLHDRVRQYIVTATKDKK